MGLSFVARVDRVGGAGAGARDGARAFAVALPFFFARSLAGFTIGIGTGLPSTFLAFTSFPFPLIDLLNTSSFLGVDFANVGDENTTGDATVGPPKSNILSSGCDARIDDASRS